MSYLWFYYYHLLNLECSSLSIEQIVLWKSKNIFANTPSLVVVAAVTIVAVPRNLQTFKHSHFSPFVCTTNNSIHKCFRWLFFKIKPFTQIFCFKETLVCLRNTIKNRRGKPEFVYMPYINTFVVGVLFNSTRIGYYC